MSGAAMVAYCEDNRKLYAGLDFRTMHVSIPTAVMGILNISF
jgi:hypothetical protein